MRLRYKRRALRHLTAIHQHIEQDNPAAADSVLERILHSIGRLEVLPHSGRKGLRPDTRLLPVPGLPYIVVHRVHGDTVEIIAILHTARNRRT